MGREATCACEWNGATARIKALLEPPELILRGAIRRRISFAQIQRVSSDGPRLSFRFGQNKVCLVLGESLATKWAQIMLAPPPSLARKLGVASGSKVRFIGVIDDDALHDALRDAQFIVRGKADLAIARVNTPAELVAAFGKTADLVKSGAPLWIVYPKGRGHAINESDVRSAGLEAGIVDVKVAAVSSQLTALKFVRRKKAKSKLLP
jgi:hypothetical protein